MFLFIIYVLASFTIKIASSHGPQSSPGAGFLFTVSVYSKLTVPWQQLIRVTELGDQCKISQE